MRVNAKQQVNVSSRQREALLAVVDNKAAACLPSLFDEVEKECMLLMRSNAFNAFRNTHGYRLCAWLCYSLNMDTLARSLAARD